LEPAVPGASAAPQFAYKNGPYGPPSSEEYTGVEALWWYDWDNGLVERQQTENGHVTDIQAVSDAAAGPCLTSITTGSGSVWVTAAPGDGPNGGPCHR
jgi:hypothetical protein